MIAFWASLKVETLGEYDFPGGRELNAARRAHNSKGGDPSHGAADSSAAPASQRGA